MLLGVGCRLVGLFMNNDKGFAEYTIVSPTPVIVSSLAY